MPLRRLLFSHRSHLATLATRGLSVLASFAVTYMLGQQFGAAVTGQYALITQTAMFLAVMGLFGLDVSVVRHFAKAVADRTKLAAKGVLAVLVLALGALGLIGLALLTGGQALWALLFGDVVGRFALPALVLLLTCRGLSLLIGGLLRSQHRFALGMGVSTLVIPATAAFALLLGIASSLEQALWATAVGGGIAVAIGLASLTPRLSTNPEALYVPLKTVAASSLPLWGAALAQVMSEWYGLAVAAQVLGAKDAGLFRVSYQISALLIMISATLWSVYSAQISTAFHSNDRDEVVRLARSAMKVGAALSAPLALMLILFGDLVLAQIGREFVAAQPVLNVLVVGHFLIACIGPSGIVLAMSGNEKLNLLISLVATAIMLVAAPLIAINAGLVGLAGCVVAVLVGRYGAAFLLVRYKLGIAI